MMNFLLKPLIFLFLGSVFSYGGVVSDEKKQTLEVIKTKKEAWPKAVDKYKEVLKAKLVVTLERLRNTAALYQMTQRVTMENEATFHSLKGTTELLALKLQALESRSRGKDINKTVKYK